MATQPWAVTVAAAARHDIDSIFDYIDTAESEARADYVSDELFAAIRTLSMFPARHRQLKGSHEATTRHALPKWSWIIYYDVREKQSAVRVVAIISSSRSPQYHELVLRHRN